MPDKNKKINEGAFTPDEVLSIYNQQKIDDAELNNKEVPVTDSESEPTEQQTPEQKQKEEAMTALKAVKDYSIAGDLSYEGMMSLLSKIEVVTDNTDNDMLSPNTRGFLLLEKEDITKKMKALMEALSDEVTAKVLSETPKSKKNTEVINIDEDSQFKLPEVDSTVGELKIDENKQKIDTAELENNIEVVLPSLKDNKNISVEGSIKVSQVGYEPLPDVDFDNIFNTPVTEKTNIDKPITPSPSEVIKVKNLEIIDEAIKENFIFNLEKNNFIISKSAIEIFNRPSYSSEFIVEKTKFVYKTPKDADFGFEFFKNSDDVKLREVIDKAEKLGYVLCPLSEVLEIFSKIEKPKKGKRLFIGTKPIYDFKGNKVYFGDINYELGKNTIDTINYDYVLKGDETLLFIQKNK